MNITIRRANESDINAIVHLTNDGGPVGKPREVLPTVLPNCYLETFKKISANADHHLMVVEINREIVGTFHMVYILYLAGKGKEDCQLEAVHVKTNWRNKGIGTTLMHWVILEATRRNCRRIQLTTDKIRKDAHRFYERLGFQFSHEGAKLLISRPL